MESDSLEVLVNFGSIDTVSRAPLQLPFQMAKEAVRTYTGLRKHRK